MHKYVLYCDVMQKVGAQRSRAFFGRPPGAFCDDEGGNSSDESNNAFLRVYSDKKVKIDIRKEIRDEN